MSVIAVSPLLTPADAPSWLGISHVCVCFPLRSRSGSFGLEVQDQGARVRARFWVADGWLLVSRAETASIGCLTRFSPILRPSALQKRKARLRDVKGIFFCLLPPL